MRDQLRDISQQVVLNFTMGIQSLKTVYTSSTFTRYVRTSQLVGQLESTDIAPALKIILYRNKEVINTFQWFLLNISANQINNAKEVTLAISGRQGAPHARGPHSSAPQPRGSPNNAGTRGNGGPRGGAWRGRAPQRGWSSRASQGGGGIGRWREPWDPCTQQQDMVQVPMQGYRSIRGGILKLGRKGETRAVQNYFN